METIKIMVVSDTHGMNQSLFWLLESYESIDLLIHCGDVSCSPKIIEDIAGCPCRIVAGNNDFGGSLPKEIEFDAYGFHFFVTHGHRYFVKSTYDNIERRAKEVKADLALFGHTHEPFLQEKNGITLINPGSLTYPAYGRDPSFAMIERDREGNWHREIRYI